MVAACRALLDAFLADVQGTPGASPAHPRALGAIVEPRNVSFDPFDLVSHATDATDWRLHLPLAVVWPTDEAQVAPLLAAIGRLGLKAIPRGAGTGLTGGAVPLRAELHRRQHRAARSHPRHLAARVPAARTVGR